MLDVRLPVLGVLRRQRLVPDDQHVLGVLLLRRLGEIETPRDNGLAVENHHLIMRDGMFGINHRGHALVGQEVGRGVFLGPLAFVEDHLHRHTPLVAVEQCFGDRGGGEAVGLDKNADLGVTKGVDSEIGTVPAWGEAYRRPAGHWRLGGGRGWLYGRRSRRSGHTRLPGEAVLIIRALVTAPRVATDVGVVVRGAAMEPVTGVLMGFAVANGVHEEGESDHHQHDSQTLDNPTVRVAHASSSGWLFSVTRLAALACNASMASTRVPSTLPASPPLRPHQHLLKRPCMRPSPGMCGVSMRG
jgi:hypothetical protein